MDLIDTRATASETTGTPGINAVSVSASPELVTWSISTASSVVIVVSCPSGAASAGTARGPVTADRTSASIFSNGSAIVPQFPLLLTGTMYPSMSSINAVWTFRLSTSAVPFFRANCKRSPQRANGRCAPSVMTRKLGSTTTITSDESNAPHRIADIRSRWSFKSNPSVNGPPAARVANSQR